MKKEIVRWIKTISDDALNAMANELSVWLARQNGASITESRTKALLLAMNALDETTLNDFRRVMGNAATVRVALTGLVESAECKVESLASAPTMHETPNWLALALMAYAYKLDYPVENLDPGSPPSQFSPAGQVVHQTAAWLRAQVQRSATERDKMARALAFVPSKEGHRSQVTGDRQEPVRRSSIPVRYFEHNDPVSIDPSEQLPTPSTAASIERGAPIAITIDDVPSVPVPAPMRIEPEPEPEIRIVGESRVVPRPTPPPSSVNRAAQRASQVASQAAQTVRENVTRENVQRAVDTAARSVDRALDSMRNTPVPNSARRTRLLVSVMDYPNGHPLPAVQIGVRVKGSKKEVAGTTNNEGLFRCSVPVRHGVGVTYEVTCHWPHEFGGSRERKRITLNAERTEFEMAFYSRLVP